jgi:predicted kinase
MKLTILVANIASGKSSYTKQYPNAFVISKDDIRKTFAKAINLSYIFDSGLEKYINDLALTYCIGAMNICCDHIIIDETNMTWNDRKPYITLAKENGYYCKCVYFEEISEDEAVKRRMDNNHGNIKEALWRVVFRKNKKKYESPSVVEGFDEITYINQ